MEGEKSVNTILTIFYLKNIPSRLKSKKTLELKSVQDPTSYQLKISKLISNPMRLYFSLSYEEGIEDAYVKDRRYIKVRFKGRCKMLSSNHTSKNIAGGLKSPDDRETNANNTVAALPMDEERATAFGLIAEDPIDLQKTHAMTPNRTNSTSK